jgi:hypothetical protein
MAQHSIDDTQPKSPLKERFSDGIPAEALRGAPMIDLEDDAGPSGPGCRIWGCMGVVAVGFAVAIVLMSAAAGWTAGKREADANATATQGASLSEQLNLIPADLNNGNLQMVDIRIHALASMTPGIPGLSDLAATATAAYVQRLPTQTLVPSATLAATQAPEVTEDFVITPADNGPQYDLAALLQEAEGDMNAGQFADAYELLDVINAVDPNFERARVRQLLTTALNGQARAMFNASNPAQGIIWATRAEQAGVLEGDVSYEMFAAINWQGAQAAIGLSYPQAVNALQQVMSDGPNGRYYAQAQQLLFEQYMGWGDALAVDPAQGYCPAAIQYQNAANLFNDGGAAAKRDQANSFCTQATPTLGPGMTPQAAGTPGQPPPSGQIAPVGQPGA